MNAPAAGVPRSDEDVAVAPLAFSSCLSLRGDAMLSRQLAAPAPPAPPSGPAAPARPAGAQAGAARPEALVDGTQPASVAGGSAQSGSSSAAGPAAGNASSPSAQQQPAPLPGERRHPLVMPRASKPVTDYDSERLYATVLPHIYWLGKGTPDSERSGRVSERERIRHAMHTLRGTAAENDITLLCLNFDKCARHDRNRAVHRFAKVDRNSELSRCLQVREIVSTIVAGEKAEWPSQRIGNLSSLSCPVLLIAFS